MTTNILNQDYSKHLLADFFCNSKYGEKFAKDLGLQEEHEHVKHARELQKKAQAAEQAKIWDKIFGK